MKPIFNQIKTWYHNLPDKKKYLELISAALTVPMLLTVIIINLNNINGQKTAKTESDHPSITDTPIQVVITQTTPEEKLLTSANQPSPTTTTTPTPTLTPSPTTTSCLPEIGPIEIISPREDEIITGDSLCLNISTSSQYCPLVCSYKINDDSWSDFNNNNICLYNLSRGSKQLQVKFKNPATNQTVTLQRNFIYQNSSATPTTTPTSTNTPTPTP